MSSPRMLLFRSQQLEPLFRRPFLFVYMCIMFVCIHISLFIYIYTYINIYIYIYVYMYRCVYIYIYILPCAKHTYLNASSIQHAEPKLIIQDVAE